MDVVFPVSAVKRLIYLVVVMLIAVTGYVWFAAYLQSHWIIWAAFGLSLLVSGKTFGRRMTMIGCAAVTVMLTVFVAGLLASHVLWLAWFLFFITAFSIFWGHLYPQLFIIIFVVNLFAILSGVQPLSMTENLDRTLFVAMGALIAIVPQVLFWPRYVRNELGANMVMVFRDLKQLANDIFACYLQPEYSDSIYLYERRLHIQKNKLMQSMTLLLENRVFSESSDAQSENNLLNELGNRLNRVYEVMMDVALLRIRVTDYTIFAICRSELTDIDKELNVVFSEMIRMLKGSKYQINLFKLSEKITRLEENYQSVLQVTAKEPFVFLLFVSSLKALHEELTDVYGLILKLNAQIC